MKRKKEKENKKQRDFWKKAEDKGIDKNKFFNNLNYELGRLYYNFMPDNYARMCQWASMMLYTIGIYPMIFKNIEKLLIA